METPHNSQLEKVQETQRSLESSLAQRMTDFEKRLTSTPQVESGQLQREYAEFKTLVHGIFLLLQQQIADLSGKVDTVEMRSRRKVLLLNGITEASDENILAVVSNILTDTFQIPDGSAGIKVCHRIGSSKPGRARPVLVRFLNSETKSLVWGKKSALKGTPISVSEFLTRARQDVFMAARAHFGMRRCWTLDGVIHIKTPNGYRVKITTASELAALTREFPITAANKENEPAPVADKQQPPKKPTATSSSVVDKKTTTRKQAQAAKSK